MEDKAKIIASLLTTLRLTNNLADLEELELCRRFGEEFVLATFISGHTKEINVTCDSGTAMIKDIMKALA